MHGCMPGPCQVSRRQRCNLQRVAWQGGWEAERGPREGGRCPRRQASAHPTQESLAGSAGPAQAREASCWGEITLAAESGTWWSGRSSKAGAIRRERGPRNAFRDQLPGPLQRTVHTCLARAPGAGTQLDRPERLHPLALGDTLQWQSSLALPPRVPNPPRGPGMTWRRTWRR